MHLEQFATSQLAEMRLAVWTNIARLEKLAHFRTVEQTQELAQQRALLHRLTRIILTRKAYQPLF